jgi:putative tryptophan/tyrosine transport system substrate-binding protein
VRRREFIAGLGGAAAWPLAARAQQGERMPRVGVLMGWSEREPQFRSWLAAFIQEMAHLGWVDGRNMRIDERWTNNDTDRTAALAKELVQLQPDVILVGTTPATAALYRETRSIPIVFTAVVDPVGSGFVSGLPRPGGNFTGFSVIEGTVGGKWVQIIKEAAPHIERVAAMYNPRSSPYMAYMGSFEDSAKSLKVKSVINPVHDDGEIEEAINVLGLNHGALVIFSDGFMGAHRATVIAAATRNKVPSIFDVPFFPRDGGLLSYGPSYPDLFRRSAAYVDRILKGAKPADLPVQLPTKYEFVINLKTARTLGLDIPSTLLVRADEVIE